MMIENISIHFNKQEKNLISLFKKTDIKKNGIFLTNNIYILNNLLNYIFEKKTVKNIINLKILEPSVGTGNIIIYLLEILKYNNINSKDIIFFIKENLYINDNNIELLNIAKNNIIFWVKKNYDENVSFKNIFNIDFTNKDIVLKIFQIQKFDIIIGNPPFVCLYGKNGIFKTEETRKNYLIKYNQFPSTLKNGKLNISMFFIENSLLLLNDKGILSFIIDSSFLDTPFYYTRKYIYEKKWNIENLIFNYSSFKNVYSGQLIINLSKFSTKIKIIDNSKQKSFELDRKEIIKNDYKIFLNNPYDYKNILDLIYQKTKTITNVYNNEKIIKMGPMFLSMENQFVSTNNQENNKLIYPYYKGSKSVTKPFFLKDINLFFEYNKEKQNNINEQLQIELIKKGIKNKKRIGLGEKEIYDNPKIYIRQSANKIIATLDLNKSSCDTSLYVLSFKKNNQKVIDELKFLVGYLNSSIINFYARLKIIKLIKSKQPQMRITDLKTLPIITDDFIKKEIINLVTKILNKKYDYEKGIKKINILLYNFFNITNETDIKKIELL